MLKHKEKFKLGKFLIRLGILSGVVAGGITGSYFLHKSASAAGNNINELYSSEAFKEYITDKNDEYAEQFKNGTISAEEYSDKILELSKNYESTYEGYLKELGTDDEKAQFESLKSERLGYALGTAFAVSGTIVAGLVGSVITYVLSQRGTKIINLVNDEDEEAKI